MAYKTKEKLIEEALESYRNTLKNWSMNHKDMAEDQEFLYGQQDNNFFGNNQRDYSMNNPRVVVDLLNAPISQLENTLRSNDYSMTIHRNNIEIDDDFLQIIAGKLKSIEVDSDHKQQIAKAAGKNGMLVLGIGFLKVYTEFVDDKSFDQKIKFKGFSNNLAIMPSYDCHDTITFSDASYWIEFETYSKQQYENLFGDSELTQVLAMTNGEPIGLYENEQCTVLKYWYKDDKFKTIYEYGDGTVTDSKDNPPTQQVEVLDEKTGENVTISVPQPIVRQRKVKDEDKSKVKWLVTNGVEILDQGDWHNATFPFVGFVGNFGIVENKKIWYGAVRNTKSSQLMYNFYASQNAKRLATSGIAPWMVAASQIKDDRVRQAFEASHYAPQPVIVYTPAVVPGTNQAIQEPHRADMQQPDIQGTQASMASTKQDILATLGIADFAMSNTMQASGNKVNPSGVAIDTLAQQGQLNNLQYTDNFVSSYKRLATIILELFSYIYDTPRQESIIAQDGSHKAVWINRNFMDKDSGTMKYYDFDGLKTSTMMITVDTGPSFANKSSETIAQLEKIGGVIPGAATIIAPAMARLMDFTGADEVADKLEAYAEAQMPFLAKMSDKDIQNLPAPARKIITQLQQKAQQMQQQLQQADAQLQKLTFEQKANVADNDAKLKIATLNAHTDLSKQELEIQRQAASEKDEAKLEILRGQMQAVNDKRDMLVDLVKHGDKMNLEHRKLDEKVKTDDNKSINKDTKGQQPQQAPLIPLINGKK